MLLLFSCIEAKEPPRSECSMQGNIQRDTLHVSSTEYPYRGCIQAGQRGSLVLREYGYGFSLLNRDNATVTTHTTSKYDVIRRCFQRPGLALHASLCPLQPSSALCSVVMNFGELFYNVHMSADELSSEKPAKC